MSNQSTPNTPLSRLCDKIGIPYPMFWGFVGLLIFMIGDGVELGYLSPFLSDRGMPEGEIAMVFTLYGVTVGISSWLAGALSNIWGPKRVMMLGLLIWSVFEVLFLIYGLETLSYKMILLTYGLRGFGYPLFAYGFLIWLIAGTAKERVNTAIGWFWCAFTAGYPVIGSLLAAWFLPTLLPVGLLWLSLGLVATGAAIALLLVKDRTGRLPLAAPGKMSIAATLTGGVTIMFSEPAVGRGAIARVINTASQFGIWVFFPIFFTQRLGFSLGQWATLLSIMMGANMAAVIGVGMISDRWSWRKSSALFGGVFCAVACLVFYYLPVLSPGNFAVAAAAAAVYGIALAGYVALPSMMTAQAPDRQGQVMSAYSLGAGAAAAVGPLIGTVFVGSIGIQGVIWIFAALHLVSAGLCMSIKSPGDGAAAA